ARWHRLTERLRARRNVREGHCRCPSTRRDREAGWYAGAGPGEIEGAVTTHRVLHQNQSGEEAVDRAAGVFTSRWGRIAALIGARAIGKRGIGAESRGECAGEVGRSARC